MMVNGTVNIALPHFLTLFLDRKKWSHCGGLAVYETVRSSFRTKYQITTIPTQSCLAYRGDDRLPPRQKFLSGPSQWSPLHVVRRKTRIEE